MAKKKEQATKLVAYKGFNQDLTCRDFKYEIGQTYKHEGKVEACAVGFHACEHPLDVFSYYPPATSRFAVVEMAGTVDKDGTDTKIASAEITIKAEIKIPELIAAAVKYVFDRAKWSEGPVATGENEGALASGDQGAATASGDQGAATASGFEGRVRGADGNALFLVERETWNGPIVNVWAGVAGKDGIKANTWYVLRAGKPVEVQ